MSYGYSSRIFSSAVTNIDDEGVMLLDALDGEREKDNQKDRPILFIAHSLGGLIVKKVWYSVNRDGPVDIF